MARTISDEQVGLIDAYWRAANYLSVGQIYLLDNPLLREPLALGHVKPRLLGHWGTTPGLNFVYAHLNRAIRARDLAQDPIPVDRPASAAPMAYATEAAVAPTSSIWSPLRHQETLVTRTRAAPTTNRVARVSPSAVANRLLAGIGAT